jgi:hypothetical protein
MSSLKSNNTTTNTMTKTTSLQNALQTYIENMDEKTRVAYEIAKNHLETSFDLEKSIDFQKFYKSYIAENTK